MAPTKNNQKTLSDVQILLEYKQEYDSTTIKGGFGFWLKQKKIKLFSSDAELEHNFYFLISSVLKKYFYQFLNFLENLTKITSGN